MMAPIYICDMLIWAMLSAGSLYTWNVGYYAGVNGWIFLSFLFQVLFWFVFLGASVPNRPLLRLTHSQRLPHALAMAEQFDVNAP